MFRAARFRGLSCSFVVCSRSLLLLPLHWLQGRSQVCALSVCDECRACRGQLYRLTGYVAAREVLADGSPGQLQLVECAESLARGMLGLDLAMLPPAARLFHCHGLAVVGSREAARRPWSVSLADSVQPTTAVEDSELIDQVARLYSLPSNPDGRSYSWGERMRLSVPARIDQLFALGAADNRSSQIDSAASR